MLPKIIQLFSKEYTLRERIRYLFEHSSRKEPNFTSGDNAIYCMDNEQFKTNELGKYYKIGATNSISTCKTDSQNHSPHPNSYIWTVKLANFNCFTFEEVLKHELKEHRVIHEGGEEFYNFSDFRIFEVILNKYGISYIYQPGDVDGQRIQNQNHINEMASGFGKIIEKLQQEINRKKKYISDTKDMGYSLPEGFEEQLSVEIKTMKELQEVGSSYKKEILEKKFSKIKPETMREEVFSKSQVLSWVYSRIIDDVKRCIILGDIQSGKTREIIQLIHFMVTYLKISVVVMIQNKTSGYKQLEARITEFQEKLKSEGKKTQINVHYAKNMNNQDKFTKYLGINENETTPGVIISLYNTTQLKKINNFVDKHIENLRLAPYVLITDEFDATIQSRQDMDEEELKATQQSAKHLRDNSVIEIGFTATLLGPMLSDKETETQDLFKMTPQNNYVGFDSDRIVMNDISNNIEKIDGKSQISLEAVKSIFSDINDDIENTDREYSITLINTSSLQDKHEEYINNLSGEYSDWGFVKLNSQGGDEIVTILPMKTRSKKNIIPGFKCFGDDLSYELCSKAIILTTNDLKAGGVIDAKTDYRNYQYYIKFKTDKFGIAEIITVLMEYTDKVAVISGFMASRGLSFVTTDYSRHITEMIYLPSDTSHLTKNVQDMRIFGNFDEDDIPITIYTTSEIWDLSVGEYIQEQRSIFSKIDEASPGTSLSNHVLNYEFKKRFSRKIDRPDVINGIGFTDTPRRGKSIQNDNFYESHKILREKYPGRNIVVYSKHCKLNIDDDFMSPIKLNKKMVTSKTYKNIYNRSISEIKKLIDEESVLFEGKDKVWFIYKNRKNDWPVWNPLYIKSKVMDDKKFADPPNISYYAKEGSREINLVVRLISTSDIKEGDIVLFYGKDSYYYSDTKTFKSSYYLEDTIEI
jgi:hypothetical protein